MGNWKTCTIGDLGKVIGGATPSTKKAENYDGGNIPWITPKDLAGFSGRFISRGERNITEQGLNSCSAQLMPAHTVLFSSRAPIGYIAIAEQEVCTNQGFKSVVPNEYTDYMFLYYLLKYNKDKIENLGSGTTFKEVSGSTMRGVEVSVPDSIEEQRQIASVLSVIDEKIEKNVEINENLTEQMMAIYINARESSTWPVQRLETVLSFYDHLRKPLSSRQRDGMEHNYPYYGAASIVDYVEDYIFDGTYILISEDGANVVDASGHPLIQYAYGKFWVNNHAHIVQGTEGFSCALLFALMKTVNIQSIVTGAAQPKVNQANLKNYATELPSKDEAKALSAILDPLFSQLIENDKENVSLSELRDVLLPRLMTGELDVSVLDL